MSSNDSFIIEKHGEVTLIVPARSLETMDSSLVDVMSEVLMGPLQDRQSPLVVFDLGEVDYFGSSFLSLLLRCWKFTTSRGGQLVLAQVSERANELLHMTSLDMIWPIFPDRSAAIEALQAD